MEREKEREREIPEQGTYCKFIRKREVKRERKREVERERKRESKRERERDN